jgi:hypothetical protein
LQRYTLVGLAASLVYVNLVIGDVRVHTSNSMLLLLLVGGCTRVHVDNAVAVAPQLESAWFSFSECDLLNVMISGM